MDWTISQIVNSTKIVNQDEIFDDSKCSEQDQGTTLENSHSIQISEEKDDPNEITYSIIDDPEQPFNNNFLFYKEEEKQTNLKDILESKVFSNRKKLQSKRFPLFEQSKSNKSNNTHYIKQSRVTNEIRSNRMKWPRKFSDDIDLSKKLKKRKNQRDQMISNICINFNKNEIRDSSLTDMNSICSKNQNKSIPSMQKTENSFQENCQNCIPSMTKFKKSKKKHKFKKVFDPKIFLSSMNKNSKSDNLQEKFNIFLFLPQLVLLNNIFKTNLNKNLNQNSSKHKTKSSKLISETVTNISMNSSQKQSLKSFRLTEDQKHKKISKKLKRAWNLNQQIPVNIFKKQVRYMSLTSNQSKDNCSLRSSKEEQNNEDKDYFFGMKRSGRITRQRKSKLDAKNKIKNSMLRKRKQRAPLGEEKEHLEYKRLVGLKRDLNDFLGKRETPSNLSIDNFYVPHLKQQKSEEHLKRVHSHFDQIISPNIKQKHLNSTSHDVNFEYVEFLDFSFKNINKPNFLGSNVNSK
jgi:hypothetical protein